MRIHAVSKPYPGEAVNGDAWISFDLDGVFRVALIDGSGHGPEAARAAATALEALSASADQTLESALRRCHQAMHGSRGAAISIVDLSADRLTFAGVGNVDARLIGPRDVHRLVPQRGIAGVTIPVIRPEVRVLEEGRRCVLMHSDGVSQRMQASWEAVTSQPPRDFLEAALRQWGRLGDDATIVLALDEDE